MTEATLNQVKRAVKLATDAAARCRADYLVIGFTAGGMIYWGADGTVNFLPA